MSYLSEIVIAIDPAVFKSAPLDVKDAFEVIWDEPEDNAHRVIFFHDCIKWYDIVEGDHTIEIIENWLKSLDEEEYGLVELGEDNSDVRYEGSPDKFGIGYVRKVTF